MAVTPFTKNNAHVAHKIFILLRQFPKLCSKDTFHKILIDIILKKIVWFSKFGYEGINGLLYSRNF